MAARSGRAQALSNEEIASLRQRLSDGGRPRVHLSGPLFPDGSTGTVLRVGDPATDGADFITVRVKLNGTTDELAFAPAELSLRAPKPKPAARRGTSAGRKAAEPGPAPTSTPAPAESAEPPADEGPNPLQPTEPAKPAAAPAPTPARRGPTARTAAGALAPTPGAKTGTGSVPSPGSKPSTGAAKRRKAAPIPTVSFTVTSSGATWAVSATRGAKGLVKNVPVAPGTVTALADLLHQPGLVEAVAEINETAWAEAQTRAELLRAELEELEAVLAAHRSPH